METIFTRLADQLPVAVLFAVFVIYWTDRIQRAQDKRDEMMRAFWKEQQEASRNIMQALTTLLEAHDKKTDDAISTMNERTRPRGGRRETQ